MACRVIQENDWRIDDNAFLHRMRGGPDANLPGGKIMKNAGPSANHDSRANLHTRPHKNVCREPDIIPDLNRRPKERKGGPREIMRARTQMTVLADRHPCSDRDGA